MTLLYLHSGFVAKLIFIFYALMAWIAVIWQSYFAQLIRFFRSFTYSYCCLTLLLFSLVFASSCSSKGLVLIPQFPKGKAKLFGEVLQNQRTLAIVTSQKNPELESDIKNDSLQWQTTMEALMVKEFSDLGYYNIVDVDAQKERLREIANSQGGFTKEVLPIGMEESFASILTVRLVNPPQFRCGIEKLISKAGTITSGVISLTYHLATDGEAQYMQPKIVQIPTAVSYISLSMEGVIYNFATGKEIRKVITQSLRKPMKLGSQTCHSLESYFSELLSIAAKDLSGYLSPSVVPFNTMIYRRSRGENISNLHKVNLLLSSAYEWLQYGDIEEAQMEWRQAWELSQKKSTAISWNMAIYFWQKGEIEQVKQIFSHIESNNQTSFLGKERQRVLRFFKANYMSQNK